MKQKTHLTAQFKAQKCWPHTLRCPFFPMGAHSNLLEVTKEFRKIYLINEYIKCSVAENAVLFRCQHVLLNAVSSGCFAFHCHRIVSAEIIFRFVESLKKSNYLNTFNFEFPEWCPATANISFRDKALKFLI